MVEQTIMTGIDHPIVAVRDMAQARSVYERLGFTVTPRGRHMEWGTGNWCVMFAWDYMELRGIIDPNNTHDLGRFLAELEGLMGVAFGTDDAAASYAALVERGLKPQPVRELTRNFELPEGPVRPRFSLCFLDKFDTPGLMSVVLCQHLTPELLRRPEWLRHANGALGVRALGGVVADLDAARERYAKLFGRQAIDSQADRIQIRVNSWQTILLLSMKAAQEVWPQFALPYGGSDGILFSVTLEVEDSSATERYFGSKGIACERTPANTVRISPPDACGVHFEFTDLV